MILYLFLSFLCAAAFGGELNVEVRAQSANDERVLVEVSSAETFEFRLCDALPIASYDINPAFCRTVGVPLPNTRPTREALAVAYAQQISEDIRRSKRIDIPLVAAISHFALPSQLLMFQAVLTNLAMTSRSQTTRQIAFKISTKPGMILSGLGWLAAGHIFYRWISQKASHREDLMVRQSRDLGASLSGIKATDLFYQGRGDSFARAVYALGRATERVADRGPREL